MNNQKKVIIGGITLLLSVVSVSAIYLPFYSHGIAKRKEDFNNLNEHELYDNNNNNCGGSKGSMWGNIEKERLKNLRK
jgi:hypothetical protein